jgi:hypothetical protein
MFCAKYARRKFNSLSGVTQINAAAHGYFQITSLKNVAEIIKGDPSEDASLRSA